MMDFFRIGITFKNPQVMGITGVISSKNISISTEYFDSTGYGCYNTLNDDAGYRNSTFNCSPFIIIR